MQRGQALSEPVIAWWLNVKGVGESLRERYPVPEKARRKRFPSIASSASQGYRLTMSEWLKP